VAGGWGVRALHREEHVEVRTAAATQGTIVRRIIATGTLEAVTTVQVGAQVSGTIQSLTADYNSVVHKGEVVARLDPSLFEADLRAAKATLEQAEAARNGFQTAVQDARTKLNRAEALASRDLIPRSDLDAARIAMDQANADLKSGESQVQQARASLEQAKVALDHTIIRSPIDGIVVARNVDVGQTVAATLQAPVLFNIAADLKQMQVELDVDESDIAGIERGEQATFEVESYPDQTFRGTVSQVRVQPVAEQTAAATTPGAPASSASSSTVATVVGYATIITVSNPDEKLRPGMTATVHLAGAHVDDVIRVPNNALSFRPPIDVLSSVGQPTDFPAPPNDALDNGTRRQVWRFDGVHFTPFDVRVGLTDGAWTQLLSGPVQPGDALVVSASMQRS
jgi:HlyD family secretion protein